MAAHLLTICFPLYLFFLSVSTINNGSISNTRIVNHGRSMHALVNIHLAMRIDVTHEQVQIVKSALQQYVRDSPRIWSSIINFRISKVGK